MKFGQLLLVVVLAAVTAFATTVYTTSQHSQSSSQPTQKETRLDQVKRTGVIRCGYIIWPPYFTKDANNGQYGGVFYDLVEEIGRQLKLKIEWAAEVSMGQMLADLALNRYDMICGPFFTTPSRAREGDFTVPLFYAPANLYVRANDTRFDNNYALANQPDIKFVTIDGEYSSIGANEDFPAASKVALTQLSSGADLFMTVKSKKADVVVSDPYSFANYNAADPGTIRAAAGKPLRISAISMPIPANEPGFKDMIDLTIAYLQNGGFINKVLDKYEGAVKSVRAAKAYQE